MTLRTVIDSGLEELPDFLLALRLAEESGYKPRAEDALRAIFRDAVTTLATVAREAAPGMSSEDRTAHVIRPKGPTKHARQRR